MDGGVDSNSLVHEAYLDETILLSPGMQQQGPQLISVGTLPANTV